jgi:hypothetical protein
VTRDELEAVIWRGLTKLLSEPTSYVQHCALVDGILDAADAYALAEYGITADRRAELVKAVSKRRAS